MISLNKAACDLLLDPLSGVTRSARRGVLLFSSVCIIVGYTGLSSSDVGILGIKLSNISETQVFAGLLIILLFNLLTFILHASSDLERYRYTRDEHERLLAQECYSQIHNNPNDENKDYLESEFEEMTGYKPYELKKKKVVGLSWFKFFLDFVFPLAYGCFALAKLAFQIIL